MLVRDIRPYRFTMPIARLLLLLVVLAPSAAFAQEDETPDPITYRWHAVTPAVIEGQAWRDTASPFDRFPGRAMKELREPVWHLSRNSTGMSVRFTSDATHVRVRWTVTLDRLALPHMPATGVSGLDLYAREDGAWYFVGGARPTESPTNDAEVIARMTPEPREFKLYLPLYNGVSSLEVGVPEDASFRFEPPSTARPVVVYGTSITQGCCASRPGMAYTAILERRLGVPFVNLGFSGNGKAEPEVARLLAELDPAVYVLDPLPNLKPDEVAERMPRLIETIRAARPRTPIVLVEHLIYPNSRFRPAKAADIATSNAYLRRIYEERRAAGDTLISFVPSRDLLGRDGDGTVDDSHPTELGFGRMADGLEPYIRQALAAASSQVERKIRKLLAVFAHPDDETMAGPLLAHYGRQPDVEVHLVITTSGDRGVTPFAGIPAGPKLAAARAEEAACAARELGTRAPILYGLPDGGLHNMKVLGELAERLTQTIRDIEPDAIVTWGPEGGYGHADHRLVSAVVTQIVQAGDVTGRLYYAALPASGVTPELIASLNFPAPFRPTADEHLTLRVPYTDEDARRARAALGCHVTQFTPQTMDLLTSLTERVNRGTAYLRPWAGDGRQRTDIFEP